MNDAPGQRLIDAEKYRLAKQLWLLYIVSGAVCFVGAGVAGYVATVLGMGERGSATLGVSVLLLPFPLVAWRQLKTGGNIGDLFYLHDRRWQERFRPWITPMYFAVYPLFLALVYFSVGNH